MFRTIVSILILLYLAKNVATATQINTSEEAENEQEEQFVRVKDAAEYLGIAPASVYRIIRKGHAKTQKRTTYKYIKTKVEETFVSLDDLEQYREEAEKYDSIY